MKTRRPLLTIAVPTFNRAEYLEQLLSCLAPQLGSHPEIELLISDNASTDSTPSVVSKLEAQSVKLRYVRNEVNIGADANFLQCFEQAQGKYVWLIGDDDLVAPRSLDKLTALLANSDYALIYLRPYVLRSDGSTEREEDRFGRFAQRIPNGPQFIRIVGTLIGFISAVVVNRERYASLKAPRLDDFVGTNLMQLGWCLPLLASGGESLIIWDKILAARAGNSSGWGICQVFGENLNQLLMRTIPERNDIRNILVDFTLREWFPCSIIEIRSSEWRGMAQEDFGTLLRVSHGRNWRYWVYISPVVALPQSAARAWWTATRLLNRAERMLRLLVSYPQWRRFIIRPTDF